MNHEYSTQNLHNNHLHQHLILLSTPDEGKVFSVTHRDVPPAQQALLPCPPKTPPNAIEALQKFTMLPLHAGLSVRSIRPAGGQEPPTVRRWLHWWGRHGTNAQAERQTSSPPRFPLQPNASASMELPITL
ncbi:hypothetical protein GWK47_010001 [Chionoecetes opilio]|uniref:Uncharacterized protein n=1 Tax=Chionoecetes opilio TaxID=41210 RepID=A0A8J4Y4V3_CHIOP|nr:hypothetical protein GWK47_010001 [Chionoecetes opilio]